MKFKLRPYEILESRCLLAANIVINEIHYDPPDKTEFSEYVELYNRSARTIDVSGWKLTDGIRIEVPPGTSIDAGAYLVISQDPDTAREVFDIESIGPWEGKLKNSGERIQLRNASGGLVDEVDYQRGFPWPTVGEHPGNSIELIHPDLDNDLGGNWRRAGSSAGNDKTIVSQGSRWQYFPGTNEPSSPRSAWRKTDFDGSAWQTGLAPIGYGDDHVETDLPDMRGNYTNLFLRQEFELDSVPVGAKLVVRAQFDDGFHLWINGRRLLSENTGNTSTSLTTTAERALENLAFVEFEADDVENILVAGTNVVAVQLMNASLGGSSDAWFDAELALRAGGEHTPGAKNLAHRENAPPAIRKVSHGPAAITSNEPVIISAKVTDPDGVADVSIEYQVVEPGDYFGRYLKAETSGEPVKDPRYDNPDEWTSLSMQDRGRDGDDVANDDIYSVVIPASVQRHRHLIRYRINVADSLGASAQAPYADDPQHNFAYFVYDEIPDWTAADQPGRTPDQTFELDEFNSIATYHLLTTAENHQDSQHIPNASTNTYSGSEYLWPGTLVYEGQVYDNIRYRARGGVWRYAMGKNMWKFDFNRGHGFQAKDDYGQEYNEEWDKLNFSALIQQGNYLHRGEQGLFESVGFKLFNLAGVESPHTHYVHFRVIDSEQEVTSDQYQGDFQGLYLAIEQPDGRMLEEHGLPDGNLYKIEGHQGTSNNQGPTQVSNGSDVRAFISGYRNTTPSADWWRENLDLDRYYSYRTIVDAIHHYDIAYGKNYFYYHNPETDKFQVLPWDLDLTWANNMFGSGEHDFVQKVARNREFRTDYQNRVRELGDLLFNDEQTGMLIDEFASMVYAPGALSWVDADRAMWDYNPILRSSYVNSSKAGNGRFYRQAETNNFPGMIKIMKDYVVERSRFLDARQRSTERDAPETPVVEYVGDPSYAINSLRFRASDYVDPEDSPFIAMEWRIAEITDPENPNFGVEPPKYEIDSTYETGVLSQFERDWTVPASELQPGTLYRVRVRMQNSEGIWSHWSAPAQFTSGPAFQGDVVDSLRISEIHYHPADPSRAELAAGFIDANEFEFIEVVNIRDRPIDLSLTSFEKVTVDGEEEGVEFAFDSGTILQPGEVLLVVEDIDAFRFRYGETIPVAGQWSGKLGNGGERVTLRANGAVIHEFHYDDAWYRRTDGDGYSLEKVDVPTSPIDTWSVRAGWKASEALGGTPGLAGLSSNRTLGDFDGNQLVDFTDFLILSANFGRTDALPHEGDANDDKLVNFADFLLLANNFGN